jgi:ABC-2 type transport system ATP-binding protein
MTHAIEVRELVKRYAHTERPAVDGLSLSVAAGEFVALLGPNGAGKTTTISILTTTLAKTSGEVLIGGHDIDRHPDLVRKSMGVLFQEKSVDADLTAEEHLRIHAAFYGLYPYRPFYALMPKEYKTRILELAERFMIRDALFELVGSFSGGMRRKLEVMRSLFHRPAVLFLDEPSVGLDPVSRKTLWEYLHEVRKESQTTVFLTTHYLNEAESADRVYMVNRGKIVLEGTPDSLKRKLLDEKLLLDARDRMGLKKELLLAEIPFAEKEHIEISLSGKRNAQSVLRAIETPLSLVRIDRPTLEEAYIAIVKNGTHHAHDAS